MSAEMSELDTGKKRRWYLTVKTKDMKELVKLTLLTLTSGEMSHLTAELHVYIIYIFLLSQSVVTLLSLTKHR